MWHEARKQERKLRKVIVDYKKRSERRHQYYERIKQDPTKFLQVHGRKSRIHLDGTVAVEAENNNHMMPWLGDASNMIDRFDVRAHLDYYQETLQDKREVLSKEEQKCNFERYRVLIWNEYKKISERQHLKQIYIDEEFPELASQQKQKQDIENHKKILSQNRASIGYDYEDNAAKMWQNRKSGRPFMTQCGSGDDDSSDDDFDILQELEEIPPLSEISMDAVTAMDEIAAKKFGLSHGSFGDSLVDDQNHIDQVCAAKDLETEKRKFSGRKSRKERRLVKEEQLKGRLVDSLSYVRQELSESSETTGSETSSSDSSEDSGELERLSKEKSSVEYITSFGGESSTDPRKPLDVYSKRCRKGRKKASYWSPSPDSEKILDHPHGSSSHVEKFADFSRSKSLGSLESSSRSHKLPASERKRDWSHFYGKDSYHQSQSIYNNKGKAGHHAGSLLRSLTEHKTAEQKAAAIKRLTPQQKLKIKMQRALNKQLKFDRHADKERRFIKRRELLEREGDLRAISRKIRRREFVADECYKSSHSNT